MIHLLGFGSKENGFVTQEFSVQESGTEEGFTADSTT